MTYTLHLVRLARFTGNPVRESVRGIPTKREAKRRLAYAMKAPEYLSGRIAKA